MPFPILLRYRRLADAVRRKCLVIGIEPGAGHVGHRNRAVCIYPRRVEIDIDRHGVDLGRIKFQQTCIRDGREQVQMRLLVAMRRNVEAIGLRHCRNLHEFGDAAHIAHVRIEDCYRLGFNEIAEAVLGVLVLSGSQGNGRLGSDLGEPVVVVGLSGFLITALLVGEYQRTGTVRLGRFYARRALRLLPAFALTLVGVYVVVRIAFPELAQAVVKEGVVAACYLMKNSTGWSAEAFYDHYWSPTLRTVLMVGYSDITPPSGVRNTDWASGGLSDADIEKMVKDAESHAAEDKKRRAAIEAKNQAEALIHSAEKQLKDNEGKVAAADKTAVESAIAALAWVRREIHRFGGNAGRISLSGHSAGAHLVAECLAHDWAAEGLDPTFVSHAVLISGIYDPRPVVQTSVNAEVQLTEDIAARRDVERRRVHVQCPATIFVGGLEPWHWIDQSYRYSHHLHRSGMNPEVHTLPRWGHFDILNEFREAGSPILKAAIGPSC